ncbi:MAG TPA: MarR family transcriptional regulator [Propionibacteriaceae bacterium]|nr:MarR family transcriptional regulator [Propionibacteriaceae bacterium]
MAEATAHDESTGELFARNARSLRRLWADAAAPFGLSPHQVRALRVIGDAPIRPGALAERLHIAARSVTDVVDSLEQTGLIARAPDPGDRRAVVLDITPAGRRTLADVLVARDEAVEGWLGRLSERDRDELHRILTLLDSERHC